MMFARFAAAALLTAISVAHAEDANRDAAVQRAVHVCASCHGEAGRSTKASIPNLATQMPLYLINQLKDFRSQTRAESDIQAYMWGVSALLDDSMIEGLAEYYASQTPAPGSEPALRQLIIDLSAGTPHYDSMTPEMATLTREQLGQLQTMLNNLGAVRSVNFKEVTPDGSDVYKVTFANGVAEFGVTLQGDGIISGVGIFNVERH